MPAGETGTVLTSDSVFDEATIQSDGKSPLENPGLATMIFASAYWREHEGALVRLQRPEMSEQWCVNHCFRLPG